ncbi:YncE family protein [Vibrio bivalvicida]|uniref:Strictosidine synthase conserved region domain-containing protein n=1 Tax=Vibrio bivalvicida TaxID=1276888 RepID=A0A177Y5L2_9VIBR|nr:hypothetical protein [Vibrio bivalvicida]OAJ96151.1 hypothetical protein APB76_01200 [Vibrio bivalvicida]
MTIEDNSIEQFLDEEIADSRGLTFSDKFIAVSDGFNGRVILLDINTKEKATVLNGLQYPNGISFTKDHHLYIVEEHKNVIRKFDIADWSEVWRSPKFQLQSPSSAYEIESGMYQGKLLIAEADGNRIFIVEPKKWKVLYEINNLRSVLKAIPVYN